MLKIVLRIKGWLFNRKTWKEHEKIRKIRTLGRIDLQNVVDEKWEFIQNNRKALEYGFANLEDFIDQLPPDLRDYLRNF